jgi:hypothetical protein
MRTTPDLAQTAAAFETWRATRTHQTAHIPDPLRRAAVALLDRYSMAEVCRTLHLRASRLGKLQQERSLPARQPGPPSSTPTFVELTDTGVLASAAPPSTPPCRVVLERADGSRLAVWVPSSDWAKLESLCSAFLAG